MKKTTLRALSIFAAFAAAGLPGSASAQGYPSRTVTVVVPIAAGGAVDTTARIFAEQLQAKLGQPFVVENRTGRARPSAPAMSRRRSPTATRCC